MITTSFTGVISEIKTPVKLSSGQTMQVIRIEIPPPINKLGNTLEAVNYLDVQIFGKTQIADTWKEYRDQWPAPTVTIKAQIRGTLASRPAGIFNNITLRLISITYHYDN